MDTCHPRRSVRLLLAAAATSALLSHAPALAARALARPPAAAVSVRFAAGRDTVTVPSSFLGLSLEYWLMRRFESAPADFGRLIELLRPADSGSVNLRIGGQSSDWAQWIPGPHVPSRPPWAKVRLDQAWLRGLAGLVRANPVRVVLGLNLAAHRPAVAASYANAALHTLPAGSIRAFEVGNEPNLYSWFPWYRVPKKVGKAHFARAANYGLSDYLADYRTYARALGPAVQRVGLAGLSVANGGWTGHLSTFMDAHPPLAMLTAHRYPLFEGNSSPSAPNWPTIPRLLSDHDSHGQVALDDPVRRAARMAGIPFRMDEFNSVAGGGAGVANTFASALWMTDALFEQAAAGDTGVDVHDRPGMPNLAFDLESKHGLRPHPVLYGMLLFVRALGQGGRIVPVNVAAPTNVKVWAVRDAVGTLRIVVLNKASRRASVTLPAQGGGPFTIERMTARSVRATHGVTLAGQAVGRDARWHGAHRSETLRPRAGRAVLAVPGYSGALVTEPAGG